MPSPTRTLDIRTAANLIREWSFPEISGENVGVEIEWFTTPSAAPPDNARLRELLTPLLPLPGGSSITFEPGGQVELSSAHFPTYDETCNALSTDTEVVRRALASHHIGLFAAGLDPDRLVRLMTDEPRYVAMKEYCDARGSAGGRMMCTSAAVHVNIDAGADGVGRRRWRLAHKLGPTLVAAFANSPIVRGRPTGWKSTRMAAWLAIDQTRAAPVDNGAEAPAASWAAYALHANVMFVRAPKRFVPLAGALPFARWIDEGHELGYPTDDDLAYHLTTLFPPVRPHGWLELRMLDMVPDPWWRVAVAITTALLYDEEAGERAGAAAGQAEGLWLDAARSALGHPRLRSAARGCFDAAIDALDRMGCDPVTATAVADYTDRYVRRGLCPADDRLHDSLTESKQKAEAP